MSPPLRIKRLPGRQRNPTTRRVGVEKDGRRKPLAREGAWAAGFEGDVLAARGLRRRFAVFYSYSYIRSKSCRRRAAWLGDGSTGRRRLDSARGGTWARPLPVSPKAGFAKTGQSGTLTAGAREGPLAVSDFGGPGSP